MNFARISSTIDVERMQTSHVTFVGGPYGLARDLVRCGLGSLTYVDYDHVSTQNPARQDFYATDLGDLKIEALVRDLRKINPEIEAELHARDFCEFTPEEIDTHFGHTDLFVFATDWQPAQKRGNVEALKLSKPAVWIGLYKGARAGEIIYYVPGVTPACYRCICSDRYKAPQAQQKQTVTSDGARSLSS